MQHLDQLISLHEYELEHRFDTYSEYNQFHLNEYPIL